MVWWNLQLLKCNNYRIRQRAIRWLAGSRDERAVDRVTAALYDRHYLVRKAAAQALGEIGREQALGPLIDLAEESLHYAMARSAVDALQKVLSRTAASADVKDLEQAAGLGDFSGFFRKRLVGVAYFIEAGQSIPWTVDCALIRNTARQELVRRGLPVLGRIFVCQ
jgi:HEAT repeat protein